MMYPGKDVFVHSKMCPWVESMTLEKDTKVQFQYVEKDGAPQCVRIVVLEGTTAGASAFTSFSAPMGGSGPTLRVAAFGSSPRLPQGRRYAVPVRGRLPTTP